MADNDTPPPVGQSAEAAHPADTTFTPSTDLANGDVTFDPAAATDAKPVSPRQSFGDGAAGLREQAQDRIRGFAEEGKARAADALQQVVEMLEDAAAQVDDRLGPQFGDYARGAASTVEGFASSVRDRDVDDIAADVRGFVAKSPAAAVGITAAVGFALARVVHAGLDQRA